MCGISGWFARDGVSWRPSKEFIAELIKGINTRGRDATGYGTQQDDGGMYMYKGPFPSDKFIEQFLKDDHPIGPIGLVHVRNSNVGSPKVNANNHPVTFEDDNRAVLVTHNGTVGNLEECYHLLGQKPVAEVDSALIPAALGTLGGKSGMEFLVEHSCGSAAFAALFDDGSLILARDLSPLYIGYPMPGVMIWSSEADVMKRLVEKRTEFDLPVWPMWGVENSFYWHWNKYGNVLSKGKFLLKTMFNSPSYLKNRNAATAQETTNQQGQKKEDEKKPDVSNSNVVDLTKALPASQFKGKRPMEKDMSIPCNWSGCWKKSFFRIHYANTTWVPLCQDHTTKWEKKGHAVILSGEHELQRKKNQSAEE